MDRKTSPHSPEIESDISLYPFRRRHLLEPAGGIPRDYPTKFILPDKLKSKLKGLIPQLYRELDNISGKTSYHYGPDTTYASLNEVLTYLVEEKTVKHIQYSAERYNDAPAFHRIHITPDFSSAETDGMIFTKPIGHGFGKNPADVFSKAIGELLERYCLMLYRQKDLTRSSYATLKQRNVAALNPAELSVFAEAQHQGRPRLEYTNHSVFSWETVTRISTGERVLAPAQLAHWNYLFADDEPVLQDTNTNGAGGYFSREGAILSGLYELIQRDAFLIHWLNEITPPKINPEDIEHAEFQALFAEAKQYGFGIHCLDLTLDLPVPTVAVVITDESGVGPYFSLGASCNPNPFNAFHRAFEEAWSVYYWIRPRPSYELPRDYQPFRDASLTQDKRLRLAANVQLRKQYDFLLEGKTKGATQDKTRYPSSFPSETEELKYLVKTVESMGPGYEVYAFTSSHSTLETLGYHSAQVIIPRIVPLYLNEAMASLGARRLTDVPAKLNLNAAETFNTFPHPFP